MQKIKRAITFLAAALMTLGLVGCDINVQVDVGSGQSLLESLLGGGDGSESTDGESTGEEGASIGESTEQESGSVEDGSQESVAGGTEGETSEADSSMEDSATEGNDEDSLSDEKESVSDSGTEGESSDSSEENSSDEEETGLQFKTIEFEGMQYAYVSLFVMGTETQIEIPATYNGLPVVMVGEGAFRGSGVTAVALGENVAVVAPYAFADCKELTMIGAYRSIQVVQENAFLGCDNLTDVYYEGTQEELFEVVREEGNDVLETANLHCQGDEEEEPPVVTESKTVITVGNFDGAYGSEWLAYAIAQFEDMYAATCFEPGKKGIKVVYSNDRSITGSIGNGRYDVYITEGVDYQSLAKNGMLLDISEAVVSQLFDYGEYSSIEDRMSNEQKAYYQVDGRYYAIPNYSMAMGLIYDIDLFETKNLYFADGSTAGYKFVRGSTDKRTAGPDGIYNTADDGLPTTYEEFFVLCEEMAARAIIPMTWSGAYADYYMGSLFRNLVTNDLGAEQALLPYTMNGTANSVGSLDGNSGFVKGEPITIVPQNAFELYRRVEQYDALKFLNTLLTNKNYYSTSAMNSAINHIDVQYEFISNKYLSAKTPIAMLAEGVWWQYEARDIFEAMAGMFGATAADCNYGWMPLPRASADKVGQKNVYTDTMSSIMCADASVSEDKIAAVIEFFKFLNTERQLAEFTEITGAPKALEYELTEEQISQLTPFGKSVWEFRENADVVYAQDIAVGDILIPVNKMYGCGQYNNPFNAFRYNAMTAEEYFEAMYAYYRRLWEQAKWS